MDRKRKEVHTFKGKEGPYSIKRLGTSDAGNGGRKGEASSCPFLPFLRPRSQRFHRWSPVPPCLFLKKGDGEASHHDAYHRHQLDEDVQRWAGDILERVANRIANNR